ncbi:RING-H2 finger protein ATL74 [Panicum miliaceum]|uniref:RING-type E3 ubiquitin transferase n=1 Tax=Panicum miliaceum TaxID=4540 RepID=A0A3L6PRT6_PANMI|nr:RING-H2 finger protein ATL74 [Panicum miliaceum]
MHRAARRLMWGASQPGTDVPSDHDVVIVLASLLCAMITVLGIGLVARCACGRGGASRQPAAANRGVKKSVLRKIPTVPYAAACGGDEESGEAAAAAEECAICLAEFEEGESVRVLPPCGHGFHAACIDKWLRGHSTCPSCRRILSLRLPPGERCSRCGARPHAGDGGWKPTSYSGVPPFLP